jgi:RNA polymerase sigma-70 factor (ECF subfamily)
MNPSTAKQPNPALAATFAEHHAFVRERLRGLGVAPADLDDATQDVFEVLVRRIADFDPQRPIRAWMAGMARKVARRYRDRGRRAIVPLDERRPAPEGSPEDRAAQAEAWQVLQRFVNELEPERWSVFVLSEIEGLRGSEIAAELGLNLNTVYARLRSARLAFERTLVRHRARERRRLTALFVWPSEWSRRWAFFAGVTLSGGVALSVALTSCARRRWCRAWQPGPARQRASACSRRTLRQRPAPRLGSRADRPLPWAATRTASATR